ncbi:MAG: thiamine pyrophosphate protein binding protein [Aeromicrobium sp.]|nr:thiamine pyrophosphate protein binding protein [Aeromicrobium sp.]
MTTVANMLVTSLADAGVTSIWGVVGDALNPVTDAIRTEDRIEWIGVRHEEAAAFAVSAQAQLTGTLGVCAGTVGPGSIHLLNGLYDAKKSRAPVLAICGQVPREELGSDFFQEVDNDQVFADVAVFTRTISDPAQAPLLIEQAVNAALQQEGVAVLTLPGDVGDLDVPKGTATPSFVTAQPSTMPSAEDVASVASVLNAADKVTLLVGLGARDAHDDVLAIADTLAAPMVVTLKAKEDFDDDNPFEVGQSGLIGNPAAQTAFEDCDVLFLVGTDFPYREWYPEGKTVIQLDRRGENIGRRTHVEHALVGDCAPTLAALRPQLTAKTSRDHLDSARHKYDAWRDRQSHLAEPQYDHESLGRIRKALDNPEHAIRPEAVGAALDRHAAADAIFTTDTGMSTVWLARFVRMTGDRRLVGSFNLGSMANAMPQALGASALDRHRQIIAFCGDGGLTMLTGDLITAVTYDLPVKLVVFDNSRLGMVKLEQEQGGLPEFGTVLHNPDLAAVARACGLHGVRVESPDELDGAVAEALAHPGPVLLDVVTNPDEISIPGRTSVGQAWGFAIAKIKETLESR